MINVKKQNNAFSFFPLFYISQQEEEKLIQRELSSIKEQVSSPSTTMVLFF